MSGAGRYDPRRDDRLGYCVLVVFGDGIDTNDLDGHHHVLRVMEPDEVISELDNGEHAVTDNDGRGWRVAGVARDQDPVDHCERIPIADIPVTDAAAAVLLTDERSGERRYAVAYCQAATVAEVHESREGFASAFGAEMPAGAVDWARRNPPAGHGRRVAGDRTGGMVR